MTKVITYGRTPIGQVVYDLGFTTLSDSYLARKHGRPIAIIRRDRAAVRKYIKAGLPKKQKVK